MSQRELNAIAGRMSLRPPQTESLTKLASAIEASPAMLLLNRDSAAVAAILATLKSQFPTLQDFERDFQSVRFVLATGVGKTRLMGAVISYLFQAHALWCQHASNHARANGTQPWRYLLIPHDQVTEDKRLTDYLSFAQA